MDGGRGHHHHRCSDLQRTDIAYQIQEATNTTKAEHRNIQAVTSSDQDKGSSESTQLPKGSQRAAQQCTKRPNSHSSFGLVEVCLVSLMQVSPQSCGDSIRKHIRGDTDNFFLLFLCCLYFCSRVVFPRQSCLGHFTGACVSREPLSAYRRSYKFLFSHAQVGHLAVSRSAHHLCVRSTTSSLLSQFPSLHGVCLGLCVMVPTRTCGHSTALPPSTKNGAPHSRHLRVGKGVM